MTRAQSLVISVVLILSVAMDGQASAQQIHVPPDPETPHGNLCPRTLLGTYDASMTSLGFMGVGTALKLENGMIVVAQSAVPGVDASWLLYLEYGSTIVVQPVSISGNGYVLNTQPLGDPFGVSCDVTNTNESVSFAIETSRLRH